MRVIDLFCGAGGFSEGFRQAGFNVIWAVDKWQPAVLTHQKNHANCNTILGDVEKIAFLTDDEFDRVVPDAEIIIGSPPCVDFSNSNKSGKGDKSRGIRLIEAFLRIVARKKFKKGSILKYWILENVPNAQPFVKEGYSAQDLKLTGRFFLKVKSLSSHVYKAQYFGVPSKRVRFICGDFPEPLTTIFFENELIALKHVLAHLKEPKTELNKTIIDPNYNFQMLSSKVTDHHYIQRLADFEWRKAKRLKQDKGYMGKMSFPEDVDRPARTIMATMSFSARESMVFAHGKHYRAPTIREVASLMSFPIDYRFYADSISLKYTLVGNAVPPKMAFAFARAIAEKEGLKIPSKYKPLTFAQNGVDLKNLNGWSIPIRKETPKRPDARFKYHIPYLIVKRYRVELTNYHSEFAAGKFKWSVEIHKSQGPQAARFTPDVPLSVFTSEETELIKQFKKKIQPRIKNFNEFQKIYCMTNDERVTRKLIGPYELLEHVKEIIESVASKNSYMEDLKIKQKPFVLPRPIALGYIVLRLIMKEMEKK